MMNDMSVSAVEAILFAVAEPISVGKISEIMELSEEETKAILDRLGSELDARDAGICLLRFEDRYQLSSRPKYSDYVVRALDNRRNSPLSQAAMEVLAIIAYNQPVSRAFIDEIRGVDSSSALSTLISKNLVEEAGRLDLPGRPISFTTTDNFLRCFDMQSLEDLPPVHAETLITEEKDILSGEDSEEEEE